ncbi:CoA transferase [Crenalkalicoccus roseus]|uniref:CoA transferase n=1 Tax=Crenalkalicoccus roseus TaxID=1485588 RepID=UPI0010808597|nr:CoA transferase [Crenalkalicoccus roseus]
MLDPSPMRILAALWQEAGLPEAALGWVRLAGEEPALPSSFRVGAAAQASIAAAALAAAEVWRRRTGQAQEVTVEMRHAALEFRSEHYLLRDGAPPGEHRDAIAGTYRCGDGCWLRLHTNFPHHRAGVLRLLGCAGERAAVAAALRAWGAEAFEQAAAEAGLCVTAMRSFAEWDVHPQGRATAALPPLRIERIGEAPPRPLPPAAARPLAGIRVLDLTRVIAGPVCGRTLAAHGAEVLHLTGPHLPSFPQLVLDVNRGKRAAHLDLRREEDRATLRGLVAGCDVFVQGYRPGAIAGHGFGPEALAALRPGIVCASLSAYGEVGPWAARRGFDSLVQTASGFNHAEAEAAGAEEPKPLPCQALDHASGYLLAFGSLAALLRRAEEGGSWHVRVSLAGTGRWLRGLGRLREGFAARVPGIGEIGDLLEEHDSGFGRLTALRHAGRLSGTPPRWDLPSVPLGTHPPRWKG